MNASHPQILQVENVVKAFGGLRAIDGLTLNVRDGEVLGIVGSNGAGKTAFVNCVTGFYAITSGRIVFDGADISGYPLHRRGRAGIARTFQNIRVFKRMTVLENVITANRDWLDRPLRSLFLPGGSRRFVGPAIELLERVRLAPLAGRRAGELSYGELRRLEIARALATRPKLLFLDEPSAGMNDQETADLVHDIRANRELVRAIVMIEHDIGFIRELSERVVAMDAGRKIAEGAVDEVFAQPAVINAYLGAEETEP